MSMKSSSVLGADTRVSAYRIVSLAGRGGTGEVYLARDDVLERNVALKVLAPRLANDPSFRERLMRESRLAAALDHPNVVPVYDAGEADGRMYVAMRYVEGTDLRALMRREFVSDERAIDIVGQVGGALDAAHERGLVHSDVKPSNVLVDERGHCYLADFGISRSLAESELAAEGQFQGTVDYVSPEQIRGDAVDSRSDLYSLGCVLFELLTGSVPFERESEVEGLFAHLEEPPPAVTDLRPELPLAVDAVLARALAKDPGQRYATCAEFVEDAREALGLSSSQPRRRRALVGALVAIAIAIAVAGAGAAIGLRTNDAVAAGPVGALVGISSHTADVVGRYDVPGYPGSVAVSSAGVWTADFRLGGMTRVNPETGATKHFTTAGEPRDLAVVGRYLYVAADGPGGIAGNVGRYDVGTGARVDSVELIACAIGSGDGQLWDTDCPWVKRLSTDEQPIRVLTETLVPFATPRTASSMRVQFRELTVGLGSVWVLGDAVDRRMWRLDAATGEITATIPLGFVPRSVAVGDGLVWVTDPMNDAVVPVDPEDNRVLAPIAVGRGAAGIVADDGGVWVANSLDGTVSRIDPDTRKVISTVSVGGEPHELDSGGGVVWVSTWNAP
jgi:YVTN family beta-propeller protein